MRGAIENLEIDIAALQQQREELEQLAAKVAAYLEKMGAC